MSTPRQGPPAGREPGTAYVGSRLAAVILGVDERTVVRWADEGLLEVAWTTAGGHRRFDAQMLATAQVSRATQPD